MKLTGSLFFQIRFCREETGFLFGRVSALYKGHGLLHFPAEKSRCLHGVCSPFRFFSCSAHHRPGTRTRFSACSTMIAICTRGGTPETPPHPIRKDNRICH